METAIKQPKHRYSNRLRSLMTRATVRKPSEMLMPCRTCKVINFSALTERKSENDLRNGSQTPTVSESGLDGIDFVHVEGVANRTH